MKKSNIYNSVNYSVLELLTSKTSKEYDQTIMIVYKKFSPCIIIYIYIYYYYYLISSVTACYIFFAIL